MNFFIALLLSFCINLFSLAIFKYLNFLVIPESIFLCLILTGIPLGAALAIKFKQKGITLAKSLFALIIVCLLSYIGLDICFQATLNLFSVDGYSGNLLTKYAMVFACELLFFLPLFMAYGLCEFICYAQLKLPVRKIYIAFLFGCALAFLSLRFFIHPIGAFRFSLLAIAGLCFLELMLSQRKAWRAKAVLSILILTIASTFFFSNFEGSVVSFLHRKLKGLKGSVVLQEWNEHCFFKVLKQKGRLIGFYNLNFAWRFPADEQLILSDQLPFRLVGQGKDIAILGAGGGLQIKEALPFHPRRVDAIEIIPKVIQLLKGAYRAEFDYIYNYPFVHTHMMDARAYLKKTNREYDLIYMASTDGAFGFGKTLLELHHSLSTKEAFELMHRRLKSGGILAIRQNNFFRYYFTSLENSGFDVYAYKHRKADADSTRYYYWLVAMKKGDKEVSRSFFNRPKEDEFFKGLEYIRINKIPDYPVMTITDDKPLKGGILLDRIPPDFVSRLFKGLFSITAIIGACLIIFLKNFWNKKFPSQKKAFWRVGFVAVMVGANFIVMENFLIYKLNRYLSVPLDAMYAGIIVFVIFAGIGAYLIKDRYRHAVFYLCLLIALCLCLFQKMFSIPVVLMLMVLPFIFTGSFFPAIFRGGDSKKLLIFVLDGLGAFIGAVIAFSLPLLVGFRMFYMAALVLFIVTAASIMAYQRKTPRPFLP